jgi:hypothetical protein
LNLPVVGPVVGAPFTNAPSAEYFILQRTWSKIFLPTIMHLFLVSKSPFQDFTSNSPSFVAVIQEAFNATHPNIYFTVAARDAIVVTVCPHLTTTYLWTEMTASAPSGIRTTQKQALNDSLGRSEAC